MFFLLLLHTVVEICLLFKCRRVASVKAVSVCDLYSLDRSDFDMIIKEFPKMKQVYICTVATLCVQIQ